MKVLLIGVGELDPEKYNGEKGECAGAIKDTLTMYDLLVNKYNVSNSDILLLHDKEATWDNIKRWISSVSISEETNFLIFYAGHGGQIFDVSGDEKDGRDETFFFYDGMVTDDEFGLVLKKIKDDVNVTVMTDCCNSGSICDITSMNHKANIWHFAACRDSKVAYCNESGGFFTNTLVSCLKDNNYEVSYLYLKRLLKRKLIHQECTLSMSNTAKETAPFLNYSNDGNSSIHEEQKVEENGDNDVKELISLFEKELELLNKTFDAIKSKMSDGRFGSTYVIKSNGSSEKLTEWEWCQKLLGIMKDKDWQWCLKLIEIVGDGRSIDDYGVIPNKRNDVDSEKTLAEWKWVIKLMQATTNKDWDRCLKLIEIASNRDNFNWEWGLGLVQVMMGGGR